MGSVLVIILSISEIMGSVLVIILSISEQLQMKCQLVLTPVPLFLRIALAILFTALLFVEGKDTDIFPNYQILFSKMINRTDPVIHSGMRHPSAALQEKMSSKEVKNEEEKRFFDNF